MVNKQLLLILAVLMPLTACSSFDSFRDDSYSDAADAVVDETFLLAVTSLQYVDPNLTAFTVAPLAEAPGTSPAAFKISRAGQCVEPTLLNVSGNAFTVPTPAGGSGSCDGMAELIDGSLWVELDCFDYRVATGDVTVDGLVQYHWTQVSADVQQFDIRSENPLGLDVNGDNCSGFLNYLGVVDNSNDKPFSVTGCVTLTLCGPTWNVSGEEADL